jgi:transketolase
MVDILCVLYESFLVYDSENLQNVANDFFILSKGHCALGWYATLNQYGLMSNEVLDTFQSNGSDLIAHPVKNLPLGIISSNGSLGQGLSFGLGLALGIVAKKQDRRVYVMMGDGECNEGSVWEAAASASEFGVSNLTVIVDSNGLRNDGINTTHQGDRSLSGIWSAFGWRVLEIDGHSYLELENAFTMAKKSRGAPTVIIANTVKGRGVSFMEGNNEWHHNHISSVTYRQILKEWQLDV